MVGEIRDRETADIAIKLANTGHLTFTTLHTNDAPSVVSRLYKMGIEPFLLAYAINVIVAQRLVRKLCQKCKKQVDHPSDQFLMRLKLIRKNGRIIRFMNPMDVINAVIPASAADSPYMKLYFSPRN